MRFRNFILLVSLMFFSGCRSDFDYVTEKLSDFGQEFVKQYGWPDKDQNWNTSKQYKISIDMSNGGSWNLYVLSADPIKEPDKAYILGKFAIIGGKMSVFVDGPYSLQSLYVAIGDGDIYAAKEIVPELDGSASVEFLNSDFQPGVIPTAPKMSYFFIYEIVDSASTYLDYNDIVLEVIHLSGEDKADIKLRAVGAKEKMAVSFAGKLDTTVLIADVHEAFGYRDPIAFVNVQSGAHNIRTPITIKNVKVGSQFSILNDAHRFFVTVTDKKGRGQDYAINENIEEYIGTPSYGIVVANPRWDWVSEGDAVDKKHRSFPFWLHSNHLYNTWWDTVWDPHELVLCDDSVTYRPDFDYDDMIFSATYLQANGDGCIVPDISYERLIPYTDCEIGANISFAITGRNKGDIKIAFRREDDGYFEWYDDLAYVTVTGERIGVDAGVGTNVEACHILLSTNTIQQIVQQKTNLKVLFYPGQTETRVNSVWIRER